MKSSRVFCFILRSSSSHFLWFFPFLGVHAFDALPSKVNRQYDVLNNSHLFFGSAEGEANAEMSIVDKILSNVIKNQNQV